MLLEFWLILHSLNSQITNWRNFNFRGFSSSWRHRICWTHCRSPWIFTGESSFELASSSRPCKNQGNALLSYFARICRSPHLRGHPQTLYNPNEEWGRFRRSFDPKAQQGEIQSESQPLGCFSTKSPLLRLLWDQELRHKLTSWTITDNRNNNVNNNDRNFTNFGRFDVTSTMTFQASTSDDFSPTFSTMMSQLLGLSRITRISTRGLHTQLLMPLHIQQSSAQSASGWWVVWTMTPTSRWFWDDWFDQSADLMIVSLKKAVALKGEPWTSNSFSQASDSSRLARRLSWTEDLDVVQHLEVAEEDVCTLQPAQH